MDKKYIIAICIIVIVVVGIVCAIIIDNNKNKGDNMNQNKELTSNTSTKNENKTTEENVVKEKEENTTKEDSKNNENITQEQTSESSHKVSIKIKNYGTIKLELDAKTAPITVANFEKLVKEGFYDGLTFHRIISGFMIQGGDPLGNGYGGSDKEIKGEFKSNGVENNISHVRGVISMARSGASYDSASSQFFIVHKDSKFLDGNYAAFGKVTEGMEIVDKICKDTKVEDDNGTVLKENQPVIEKITIEK